MSQVTVQLRAIHAPRLSLRARRQAVAQIGELLDALESLLTPSGVVDTSDASGCLRRLAANRNCSFLHEDIGRVRDTLERLGGETYTNGLQYRRWREQAALVTMAMRARVEQASRSHQVFAIA